jgi:hypothetical protein
MQRRRKVNEKNVNFSSKLYFFGSKYLVLKVKNGSLALLYSLLACDVIEFGLFQNALFTHIFVQDQFPVAQIVQNWTKI